jgi:hypothetical protein
MTTGITSLAQDYFFIKAGIKNTPCKTAGMFLPLNYGSTNKKKANLPYDCDFILISERWSIGVLE